VDEMARTSLDMARAMRVFPVPRRRRGEPLGRIDPSSVNRSGISGEARSSPDVAQLFIQAADVLVGGPDGLFVAKSAVRKVMAVWAVIRRAPRLAPPHEELRPGPNRTICTRRRSPRGAGQKLEDVGDLLFLGVWLLASTGERMTLSASLLGPSGRCRSRPRRSGRCPG